MIVCEDVDKGKWSDENREQLFRGIAVHGERGFENPFGLYEDEETKAKLNVYVRRLRTRNIELMATSAVCLFMTTRWHRQHGFDRKYLI